MRERDSYGRTRIAGLFATLIMASSSLNSCATQDADSEPAASRSVCRDCIRLNLEVAFGDAEGPGYVVYTDYAIRDSLGRFWLGQYKDMIKVFDSSGQYVRTVGRRGEGPAEFDTPIPLFTDTQGMVHVVDAGIPRETIMRPDFGLHGITRLAVKPWAIAPLMESAGFVANVPVHSVEALGHPLHLIRGSDIVRSFGAPETGVANPNDVRRVLTVDDRGRIYSTPLDELTVKVWTETGEAITEFEGPPVRDDDPTPAPKTLNTPGSSVAALNVDASERLWILISKPSKDWRDHVEEVPLSDGRLRLDLKPADDDLNNIFDTQIVVFDLATNSIIALTERQEYFVGFIDDSSLLELHQLEDGTPQVAVWSIEFNRKP